MLAKCPVIVDGQALLDKVRQRLDEDALADFKAQSALFARGDVDTRAYHEYVRMLGLAHLVPEIATLVPDAGKRSELLSQHRATFVAEPALSGARSAQPSELAPVFQTSDDCCRCM